MLCKCLMMSALLAALVVVSGAAPGRPVIGLAASRGVIEIDNSAVHGNANLVEGSVVKTGAAVSRLQMRNGASLTLGEMSSAKVYADHVVLEQGQTQLSAASGFAVEASTLRVIPATGSSLARIQFKEHNQVLIAALNGAVRISNREGLMLARVDAGKAMLMEPAAPGAAPVSTMSGYLRRENGRFFLPDQTTNLVVELHGKGLDQQVGRRIEVTGTARPSVDGQSQIIEVARLNPIGAGEDQQDQQPPSASTPAPKAPPKSSSGGMSAGTKTLLVIVAAGAAAGIGLGMGLKGKS